MNGLSSPQDTDCESRLSERERLGGESAAQWNGVVAQKIVEEAQMQKTVNFQKWDTKTVSGEAVTES